MVQSDMPIPQPGMTTAGSGFRPPVTVVEPSGGIGSFFLLKLFVFCTAPFFVVTGAMYQLEMFVTGGNVPISPAVLKILLVCIFLLIFILRGGRISNNPQLSAVAIVFFGYLLFDSLYLYFGLNLDPSDIALGYNGYFSLAFLGVLAALVPMKIRDRRLLQALVLLAIVCALLGVAQYIKNAPILPTTSNDGNFQVHSALASFGGQLRVFSLFDAPQACGLYFVFISALLVALCRRPLYRWIAVPLLCCSIGMCLIADARTQIAALAWAIIASAVITFWNGKNRTRLLPLGAMLSAIPIMLIALFGGSAGTGGVSSTASFSERIVEWNYYLTILRSTSISQLLFGMGFVQNSKAGSVNVSMYIDNIYLAVALDIGLIGLILYLVFAWFLWTEIRRKAESRTSYLQTALAATFSTFFLVGVFTNVTSIMCGYFLLYAISDAHEIPATPTSAQSVRDAV